MPATREKLAGETPATRGSAVLAEEHFETLKRLKDLGLPVNPHIEKAATIDEVLKICHRWEQKRSKLDYQIDGMVVKVNRIDQREVLGTTGRAPKWCISYKFAAEQAETVIESIDVQVGKTGTLTPVANLRAVLLAGTTVRRASLHNFDELRRLDARVGDTVLVEKAGEIIPQVVGVRRELRPHGTKEFAVPHKCPECGSPVQKDEGGVYVRCINARCPAQLKERILYFAGRGQMDVEQLGRALVEQLVDVGLVKDLADLYRLTQADLEPLERMAARSAANVVEAIEQSKTRELWRFVAGLGIRHVGGQSAQILAERFGSLEALMEADRGALEQIDQIGPVMAESIHAYFRKEDNRRVIRRMLEAGVVPTPPQKREPGRLAGKTIVVTGTLEAFTRPQAEQAIRAAGGKASSSVSKNTDFVLAGENPGSKLDKARKLGVKVINEAEFTEML